MASPVQLHSSHFSAVNSGPRQSMLTSWVNFAYLVSLARIERDVLHTGFFAPRPRTIVLADDGLAKETLATPIVLER